MPLAPVPGLFQQLSPLERDLYAKLQNFPNEIEREIRVSTGQNAAIRGAFLRWVLLEAIPSAAFAIANVEIKQAIFEDVLDLEAATINLLLRFVECEFKKGIELSDAIIIGFEMVGGSASKINADHLTVKGSMRLHGQHEPKSIQGPRLEMLRLCGADIHGNLDMRACLLQAQREEAKKTEETDGMATKNERKTETGEN